MFFAAPAGNFDGNDNLVDLTGATVWETSPFTLPSGSYRLSASQSVSPAFTPSGGNAVIGGFVSGNATRSFLIAPAENFNANDNLTSLAGCVLSQSQNVTGLISAVPYRALALTRASDVFAVVASDIPLRTFYDYEGARATFDAPVKVQFSADGSPVVISDRPITLISGAPALRQVGPNGVTVTSQGAMLAPIVTPELQGWDEWLAQPTADQFCPYGNNVNPGAPGNSPVIFAEGSHGAYIQSLWNRYATTYSILRYIPLVTVTPTPINPGDFRPGIANGGPARTNYGANINDINMNVFRNVPRPGNCRSIQTVTGYLENTRLRPVWSAGGGGGESDERKRRMETSVHGSYGQDFGAEEAADLLSLHWAETIEAKTPKAIAVIQRAIDLRSIMDQGYLYGYGAGQNANGWVELVYAGFLLNDPTFLTAALQMKTNTTRQAYSPMPAQFLGRNHPIATDVGSTNIAYLQPGYLEHEWLWISGYVNAATTLYGPGYFFGNDAMTVMEVMAVCMLQNGPGGMSGIDWLTSVGLDFLVKIMDDRIVMVPANNFSVRLTDPHRSAYAACRGFIEPIVPGRPLQFAAGRNTAITNGFRSNFTGYEYSRSPVIDRQARLSLDRRWGRVWTGLGAGTTDTTANVMLGTPQFEQSRFVSAEGPGLWSSAYPGNVGTAERIITPTGTPPATVPVNSHAPKILIRPYAASPLGRFEEFSGSVLPVNSRQLVGSVGYWFGGGSPTSFDYKFQENIASVWTDIVGTSGNVTLAAIGGLAWGTIDTRLVRSKSIRFAVQANSAAGVSGWVYSSAVTVPAKTEVVDYLAPDPAFGLKDVTYRYNPGIGGLLSFHSADGQYPGYVMSSSNTLAARVVTVDQLPVIGDMASIPEGEMLATWSIGPETTATTRGVLNFYVTGADHATLNCYALHYVSDSLGWKHDIYPVVNGVYGAAIYNGTYDTTGDGFRQERFPYGGINTRMNWTLEGGKIRLKLKRWRLMEYDEVYPEPVDWQEDILFPNAAIAPGRIGFGIRQSGRSIKIRGIGVSLDPNVPAKVAPEIPAYDYIA